MLRESPQPPARMGVVVVVVVVVVLGVVDDGATRAGGLKPFFMVEPLGVAVGVHNAGWLRYH